MKPELFDEKNLHEEIIDVLLETIVLGNICSVDFETEINKKINKLYTKFNFQKP